jgi:hypothetical protein
MYSVVAFEGVLTLASVPSSSFLMWTIPSGAVIVALSPQSIEPEVIKVGTEL